MKKQNKKRILVLPNSLIVTHSNKLVEARYNLPLGEQRLILTMISRIQPEDEDFKPYQISVHELAEFLGVDKNSIYRECKKTTKGLLSRVLSIEEPDGLLQIGWVSSAKYIDGTGMVNLSFDPLLKPYLLQLKSNFTSFKLNMMLSFKSQYSMRIYMFLKQYEKLKKRELELDLLRELLGIRKDQYALYSDFRKRILLSSQKELSEKSDLYFNFEEIKYGRKVGAIRFHLLTREFPRSLSSSGEHSEQIPLFDLTSISPTVTNTSLNAQNLLLSNELIMLVPEVHRIKKTVQAVIMEFEKKHGMDYVKRNILYTNVKAGSSYAGFLANALKADWGHDWQIDQQQTTQLSSKTKKKKLEIWERQGFSSQKDYDTFMFNQQMAQYSKLRPSGN
jgi:hypothetical protein